MGWGGVESRVARVAVVQSCSTYTHTHTHVRTLTSCRFNILFSSGDGSVPGESLGGAAGVSHLAPDRGGGGAAKKSSAGESGETASTSTLTDGEAAGVGGGGGVGAASAASGTGGGPTVSSVCREPPGLNIMMTPPFWARLALGRCFFADACTRAA